MSTMTDTKPDTYEGWANYPTWNVNLWLSNDQALYQRTLETLRGAQEYYEDLGDKEGKPWRLFVADWLESFVSQELFEDAFAPERHGQTGMVDDLAQWAVAQTDWLEIADAWLDALASES